MRRKTLFGKLFMYNVTIVILSMSLTAVLLYGQLGEYFQKTVFNNLETKAEQVSRMSGYLMEIGSSVGNPPMMREIMGSMGNEKGQGMIIVDTLGRVIVNTGFQDGSFTADRLDKDLLKPVFDGAKLKSDSNLNGAFPVKLMHVIVPIKTNHGILGAVVVCSTEPYSQNMQIGVMRLFLIVVIAVVIITLIVSAFFSRRISRPIKEMTVVARKIASGDFTQRVSVDSEGELGMLAKSFNQMSVALGEMDEVQTSFISDVSHELRTPMTIISGFVDGILDGTIPPEQQQKYLEVVLSETKRLNRLVNDLLEMSRLNSGKIEYKMVPFDINENIRKAIIAFEQGIDDKNIEVEVNFEDDSTLVLGNSDSIYRVITNLMDNAVKFTPEKGKITIKVETSGQKTKVSIENTGKGLTEKELAHIWDRFYQTDKSRTSSGKKGVGLGLYIVKNIMKAHENDIYAESKEGEWTRFVFELDSVKNK